MKVMRILEVSKVFKDSKLKGHDSHKRFDCQRAHADDGSRKIMNIAS